MDNSISNIILVVGCQRSGTTLLASMLGRHSEINMLFESTTKDVVKLIGKKYNGNKLLSWRQIRFKERASYWGHLKNRIVNFDFGKTRKHHSKRPAPTSEFNIEDYIQKGAKFIVIRRKKEDTIKSILKRTGVSESLALKEWELSEKILDQLEATQAFQVQFDDLVSQPRMVMEKLCDHLSLPFEEKMLEGSKYNFVYPQDSIDADKASKKQ